MNRRQIIAITKAGYGNSPFIKDIDFKECDIFQMGDVFRLYKVEDGFDVLLPKKELLAICHIEKNNWVQFTLPWTYSFNHLAAINKMREMKLIKP